MEGLSWWRTVEAIGGARSDSLFWDEEHHLIAEAMAKLSSSDSRIDIDSVADVLNRDPGAQSLLVPDVRTFLTQLQFRGSLRSVTELQDVTVELVNSRSLRDMVRSLEDVREKALSGEHHPNEVAGELRSLSGESGGMAEIRLLGEIIDEMEAADALGVPFRVPTGIKMLDKVIKGYEPGRLYVVGARPKVGKSTLILNTVLEALANDTVVILVSLEMNRRELWSKLLSAQAYVEQADIQKMLDGDMRMSDFTAEKQQLLKEASADLKSAALYMMESHEVRGGVDSVIAAAMGVKSKYPEGTKMILLIDYLQLLVKDNFNKQAELSDITRKLKLAAQDLAIPIVVPSQINRAGAEEGMPGPHQLRDSGSIEQDADCIILLNRPALQDESQPAHIMDIWVALSRYTQPGWVKAFYAPEFQTIKDQEGWSDHDEPKVRKDDPEPEESRERPRRDPEAEQEQRRARRERRERGEGPRAGRKRAALDEDEEY